MAGVVPWLHAVLCHPCDLGIMFTWILGLRMKWLSVAYSVSKVKSHSVAVMPLVLIRKCQFVKSEALISILCITFACDFLMH